MIRITCDSTADLGEFYEKEDIKTLPLMVTLGSNDFEDGVTVSPSQIFDFVSTHKKLPKTAARGEEQFYDFFKQFTDNGEEVIHFDISSHLSASNENAVKASKRLKGVYVIDSLTLSSGTGLLALYAKDLIKQNKYTAEEIYKLVLKRVPAVQASFVVDTMEYLYKGGRCSGVASIAATILKIKPSILLKDGKMIVGKKYMGNINKSILKYIDDTIKTYNTPDTTRMFITHSSAEDDIVNIVKEKIKSLNIFKEIIVTVAGSTITSHCGKGTLGILYLNDGNER